MTLPLFFLRILLFLRVRRRQLQKRRTTDDAHRIFHAAGVLRILGPMVHRRLDAEERRYVRPGSVFVWEERSTTSEAAGLGIERWTDGLRWGPSRVRDVCS